MSQIPHGHFSYGTVVDQAEVSPDSKPSLKIGTGINGDRDGGDVRVTQAIVG